MTARDILVNSASEDQLLSYVVDLLELHNWWWFHDQDSRWNKAGLPDLIAIRPPRVVFLELKSAKGRIREQQAVVLRRLEQCPGVEVYLWRPMDMDEIARVLA